MLGEKVQTKCEIVQTRIENETQRTIEQLPTYVIRNITDTNRDCLPKKFHHLRESQYRYSYTPITIIPSSKLEGQTTKR